MNPREMQKAMKRLGIKQEDIDAVEVIIRTQDSEFVCQSPSVQKVNMMGQESYQITGDFEERELSQQITISDDDVQTVVDQTGVSNEKAREAIMKHSGDLAQAILELKQ